MQIQIRWLQKPTDLDLHCLQRQGISGISRTRVTGLLNLVQPNQTIFALELRSFLYCKQDMRQNRRKAKCGKAKWQKKKKTFRLSQSQFAVSTMVPVYYLMIKEKYHLISHNYTITYVMPNKKRSYNISKTIIAPDKVLFSAKKKWYFSYISMKSYSVGTHWDASNEYLQHMFLWRNKKNTYLKLSLI